MIPTNIQSGKSAKPADDAAKSTNIFNAPLDKGKKPDNPEVKKKNVKQSTIYLGVAGVLLAVYSFLFFYPQMLAYVGFEGKISNIEKQTANYKITLADLEKKKSNHKAAYDKEYQAEQIVLNNVFPKTPEKLAVIRLLENFATHLNTSYPPFEFTSISFQKSKKENGYTVLPFRTSIHTSETNFHRFLGLVNLSGSLDPAISEHIRLMEITNISLRYRGVDKTGKDLGVDFNVQLNAYSR